MAYSTQEGEIWLVRSDGTGAHKLASVGGKAFFLSWSPDGGAIRFTRDERLWEISSVGSNLHPLLPSWRATSVQCCGRWTPDGRFFLFQARGLSSQENELWALDERRGFFRQPPADPVQLTTGPMYWQSPIPGKDGKKIFAMGWTPRGELSRFDSKTKQFQPLLGGISADSVSFSKDGRYVAYVSFPEGVLWKANRDGSNPVQLSDPPMHAMLPSWSPDGTQILFHDASSDWPKSYIVSSQGGIPRRLLPEGNGTQWDPNWSPDGQKIVWASGVIGDTTKSYLSIFDLASHRVNRVPGSIGMFSPRWSPDGRYLAALTFASTCMRVFDIETQRWSGLPPKCATDFPAWSKDGQFIYYLHISGDDRGVFRIRVKGGEAERVVDMKDLHLTGWPYGYWLGLDPTDAPLILRDVGSDDIYALTVDEK